MKKARQLLASSMALKAGVVMNILSGALTLAAFVPVELGARVRPMAWVSAVFALAVVGIALAAILCAADTRRGREREAFWGGVLCLAPFPLAMLLFKLFVALKGLRVSP